MTLHASLTRPLRCTSASGALPVLLTLVLLLIAAEGSRFIICLRLACVCARWRRFAVEGHGTVQQLFTALVRASNERLFLARRQKGLSAVRRHREPLSSKRLARGKILNKPGREQGRRLAALLMDSFTVLCSAH